VRELRVMFRRAVRIISVDQIRQVRQVREAKTTEGALENAVDPPIRSP
jgi:hypothetical protein